VTTPRETLNDIRVDFFTDGPIESIDSGAAVDAFVGAIAKIATDDFVCVMDGGALTTRYEGIERLREGWSDFLGAFETIKIEPGEMMETDDGMLEYVCMTGKPAGVDAEVDQAGAAVWRMRGDRLACVEFHIDRARARASAGVAD
jgi:hypothetical protein